MALSGITLPEGGEGDDDPTPVGLVLVATNLSNAAEMKNNPKLIKITPNYLDNPTADDGGREAVEEGEGDGGAAVLHVKIRCKEFLDMRRNHR